MELILECIGGLAIITGVVFAIAWACFFVESVRELQREMECQSKLGEQFWELRRALNLHINGNDDAARSAIEKAGGL